MLTYLKQSYLILKNNRAVMLLILLIALLGALRFGDLRIVKLMIFGVECILIVILYVSILIMEEGLTDFFVTAKKAFRYVPRFAWLFIYFMVAVIIIVPIGSIMLKWLLNNFFSTSLHGQLLLYISFTLVVVLLGPFYLYAPAFLVLKNCFVYESIREGYIFVRRNPLKRLSPAVLVLLNGYLLGVISQEHYLMHLAVNLLFYLSLFIAVCVATLIFREASPSYISMKTKIEDEEWPRK